MLSLCQCELLCLVRTARYEICMAVFVMVLLSGMLRHVDWQIVTWGWEAWTGLIWLNPLNAELNPICHLLVLLGAHHILHFSGIRFKIGKRDGRL